MTIARTLLALLILCGVANAKEALGESSPAPGESSQVVVVHRPLHSAAQGQALRFVALIDNHWKAASFLVRYRQGGGPYSELTFERSSSGGYFAELPGHLVQGHVLEYYVTSIDLAGKERLHFASSGNPHKVRVDISSNLRWSAQERRRLGAVNVMDVDLHAQNFANRYGKRDELLRSEIRWTHKLLHGSHLRLYSIHLGFGFLQGRTPVSSASDANSRFKAARYGFGGLRLQVTPSVSATAETIIGFDRSEVIAGIQGHVTFGKDWRSNLSMGAEQLQNLGPSLWMRLQWDTVPPLLMGVSVVKTDLPGASLKGGTYSSYDLSYPVTRKLLLRAHISYGSRDGPGGIGAGFGSSLSF